MLMLNWPRRPRQCFWKFLLHKLTSENTFQIHFKKKKKRREVYAWRTKRKLDRQNSDPWCVSPSAVSDSLQPHRLWLARLLCPWDFPDKNTGVGCHFHSPEDLPDPGIEAGSPALQAESFLSEPAGKLPTLDTCSHMRRCHIWFYKLPCEGRNWFLIYNYMVSSR